MIARIAAMACVSPALGFMRFSLIVAGTVLLIACSGGDKTISTQISEQFDDVKVENIDLSKVGPKNWDRVCVLAPYTDDSHAREILGFPWAVESRSSIATNDGINLLVFVKEQAVVAYTEHPRNKGDFVTLKPRCLLRHKAILVRQPIPGMGVELIPR